MAEFQERAREIYREVAQLPTPTKARVFYSDDLYELEVKWKQKDLDRGKNVAFAKSYILQNTANEIKLVTASNFQRDANSVCLEAYSATEGIKAVLVKDTTSKSEKGSEPQQFIEIWKSNRLIKSLNVKDQFGKQHGEIKDDDHFSSFQLSYDGSKLLYTAEKKNPDSISFFKKLSNDEEKGKERGTEYIFEQNWGEQLSKVISPVVVVLDIDTEKCVVIECPDDVSHAHGVWIPNSSNQLVFVGYNNNPIKLGFVYCFNRRSTLYFADLEKQSCTRLTDDTKYVYSPRFNPQGTKLVFLENDAPYPYPHRACARLRMVNWETKTISTVVDIVSSPTDDGFTGIYTISLPERCWDTKGNVLFYNDLQKSYVHIMSIDVTNGDVNCLTANTELGCYGVFDVYNDLLVGQYSNPCHPPKIFVTRIPNKFNDKFKHSDFVDIVGNDISISDMIKWKVIDLNRGEGSLPYQAIFVSPVLSFSLPPLIVYPHGGPHVGFSANFIIWNACFVALGFSVLLVNYNGSMGYGQDFIMNLIGKIGSLDIQDTQFAAETIIKNEEADGNNVVVHGGSHAGFISVHLIGRYPDYYKAAFIRNPVIDMAAMSNTSDIPDWSHSCLKLPYDPALNMTLEMYSKMFTASPIVHADKIKASVILTLGGEDKRCPPSQGKELYYLLKAQGKDIKLYWYPKDGHPLSSVDTDADCFMNCALMFQNATN